MSCIVFLGPVCGCVCVCGLCVACVCFGPACVLMCVLAFVWFVYGSCLYLGPVCVLFVCLGPMCALYVLGPVCLSYCVSVLEYTLFYLKQRSSLASYYVCLLLGFTRRDCLTCQPGWQVLAGSGGSILDRRLPNYTCFTLCLVWIISRMILTQTCTPGVEDTAPG